MGGHLKPSRHNLGRVRRDPGETFDRPLDELMREQPSLLAATATCGGGEPSLALETMNQP